ncbi:hypothetical protein BaRGS_00004652, partial [Batillaria attramentaria]
MKVPVKSELSPSEQPGFSWVFQVLCRLQTLDIHRASPVSINVTLKLWGRYSRGVMMPETI